MATPSNSPGPGPDWTIISGAVVAILGALGVFVGKTTSLFKQRASDQQVRDKAATDNAALTLKGVFTLVDELKEEIARKGDMLIECEKKIAELRMEIVELTKKVNALERQIDDRQRVDRIS